MDAMGYRPILEKMQNLDRDFRYMACSDLYTMLLKESRPIDSSTQGDLCKYLIKLLQDANGEVQGQAVKCLGPLTKHLRQERLEFLLCNMGDILCSTPKNKEADSKDIASIGIKAIISECYQKDGQLIVKHLSTKMISALSDETTNDLVKFECLDILSDLLRRFGSLMSGEYEVILSVVSAQLVSNRAGSRKRAIQCQARLAAVLPDNLFDNLMREVLDSLKDAKKQDHHRTMIQTVGAVSKVVGHRLGKYMAEFVPLVVAHCADKADSEGDDRGDDELRENAFLALESLVFCCRKEIAPHILTILDLCLRFAGYDPNYVGADDEDEESMECDDEGEADDDETFSDDDDESWKARRSSLRALTAIITTRVDLMATVYEKAVPVLVARLREREENVTAGQLAVHAPRLVKELGRQLTTSKSLKTRVAILDLLKQLVQASATTVQAHLDTLTEGVVGALADRTSNSNLKIEALHFLRCAIAGRPETVQFMQKLAPPVLVCVADAFYKIVAEALRVCTCIADILPTDKSGGPLLASLQAAVLDRLRAADIDLEVKEVAIDCISHVLARHSQCLGADVVASCLALLLDRLGNEITRLVTVKAFSYMCASSVDLAPVAPDAVKHLASFLRQSSRPLRVASLVALEGVVAKYGTSCEGVAQLLDSVIPQLESLIGDADLYISSLAINVSLAALRTHPKSVAVFKASVYPCVLRLLQSSLLQGVALQSVQRLHQELVSIGTKGFGFKELYSAVSALPQNAKLGKQALFSVAQTVGTLATAGSKSELASTIKQLVGEVSSGGMVQFSLLCLGEVGKRTDLQAYKDLHATILACFDADCEDVKAAATYALGNVAVGNLPHFLPTILADIGATTKRQYLLLHSLREIISQESLTDSGKRALLEHTAVIVPILFTHCETEEEGIRNVVSECLGKLALLQPAAIVPELAAKTKADNEWLRSTVVGAVKFAVLEQPKEADDLLAPAMSQFIAMLDDASLVVRRNALLTLNSVAHNKPGLVRACLPDHMPRLLNLLAVNTALIRKVPVGPFEHTIDSGLDVRKAAHECMYTVLEKCLDVVDIDAFLPLLAASLRDVYDIQLLSHLMLVRLCGSPVAPRVADATPLFVEPLRATVTAKVKDTSVQQDVERNEETIQSALRAIAHLVALPNAEQHAAMAEFMAKVVKAGDLARKYEEVRAELAQSPADGMETL
eukprot:CAMPEP_0177637886 /NCGR_PEP_ID=MMETSP0447-20121125/5203_1 /TAXON_ID=0 /ORGANISM="Stygamoeba regulata, Strain BSH-02190019" /LENGTH=1196 /DNA_ID=CAMNT_0019139829 /DNA_START=52 /DNA_END=3641 /DNA_ORIENTATION=+